MAYGTGAMDVVQSSTSGTPPQFNDGSGTQIGTLCRAWVNFNGTSGASPVIRASFNISSVVRNGTGNYTINFSTAMTDANYATLCTQQRTANGTTVTFPNISASTSPTTTAVIVENDGSGGTTTSGDASIFCVAIFR